LKVLGGVGVAKTVTSLGLTVTGNASIGSTLTVSGAEGITSPKFKATTPQSELLDDIPTFKMLRADGNQDFITFREVKNALGFIPANSATITGDFPLGNSLICDSIESQFNGSTTDFTLSIGGSAFVPAGSSANLIVSVGGVIQKPGTDFIIVTDGDGNTSKIRFTTAPASGVSCFIVALGGQGSLISNIDWDAVGQILVATANNQASLLDRGNNGEFLTVDTTSPGTVGGLKWTPAPPIGSVFYMAASSNFSDKGGSATIGATTYHAPEGYLICNGVDIPTSGTFQGVNASLLQSLRSFLGSTYGATGTLPNLINNFVGYSAVPGATGGAATVQLQINEIPSHNHGGSTGGDGGHSHTAVNGVAVNTGIGGNYGSGSGSGLRNGNGQTITNDVGNHTHAINAQGGGQAHQNLPPYVGMLPVIKY
jgi:microcystin-dependent protein